MRNLVKILLSCVIFFRICSYSFMSNSQNAVPNTHISWDLVLINKVTITDPEIIKFLLDNCFIFPENEVTRLDIYDVTGNGFGEKDIAETYPDRTIYFLEFVNEKAQVYMQKKFKPPDNYEKIGENLNPDRFESEGKAQSGILASLLRGVKRNVKRSPVTIWFRQDSTGDFKFMMTGYQEQKLKFTPSWYDYIVPDTINFSHPTLGDTSFVVHNRVDYDILRQFIEEALPEFTTDILKIYIIENDTLYLDSKNSLVK